MASNVYRKLFTGEVKAVHPDDEGVVAGYASTFGNVDRDGDTFQKGAFTATLKELREKALPMPLLAGHQHLEVIGGIQPEDLIQDAKGLRIKRAQFDLSIQKAQEFFSLAKKGFLTAFSIGFSIPTKDDMERTDTGFLFKKVDLFEVSIIPVPANEEALMTGVKSVGAATTLPVADKDVAWSASEAIERVRKFTGSEDAPTAKYRRAFMFFDAENADKFTAYKLPFADVIGGELRAIPRALSAIVAVLNGGRGGVDIPDADKTKIKGIVTQYFKKMGRDAPFSSSDSGKAIASLELLPLLLKLKRLNYERRHCK